jgi:hypothetical protein
VKAARPRAGRKDVADSGEAAQAYQARRRDVEKLLRMLKEEVARHAATRQAKAPGSWAFVGDLAHVRELLFEAMVFLSQQGASAIEEHLAGKPSHEGRR